MKTIKSIFAFVIASLFVICSISCGKSQINFTAYTSDDGSYVLEIPSDIPIYKCAGNIMSFKNDQTFITIKPISESNIDEYVTNDEYKGDFNYELIQYSDTSNFYKMTKDGNAMFFAYQLYMLKNLNGDRYLISVNSIENRLTAIKIINHIYASLKKKGVSKNNGNAGNGEKTYSNKFFSVKYPAYWECKESLDAMTDVYIGSAKDNFGFTVVRFETDESLDAINNEINDNIQESGFMKLIEERKTTVDGLKCYCSIQEIYIEGKKVKHTSYSFKKGKMFYNIKFGNVINESQEKQIIKIIKTFKVK